jgi:hypothetical protein
MLCELSFLLRWRNYKITVIKLMSTIEQIEAAILKLSPQEISQLADWILDLDEQRWDEQIEKDIAAGKLNFLAQEALTEFEAGKCRKL